MTVSAISLVIPVSTSFVSTFVTVFVLFCCWINKTDDDDDDVDGTSAAPWPQLDGVRPKTSPSMDDDRRSEDGEGRGGAKSDTYNGNPIKSKTTLLGHIPMTVWLDNTLIHNNSVQATTECYCSFIYTNIKVNMCYLPPCITTRSDDILSKKSHIRTRVSDPVIVIGIRFLNYSLNFMYVISDSNVLFSHRSFIFDIS